MSRPICRATHDIDQCVDSDYPALLNDRNKYMSQASIVTPPDTEIPRNSSGVSLNYLHLKSVGLSISVAA